MFFFKVQNGVNRLNLIRGKIECQVLSLFLIYLYGNGTHIVT